ncbi:GntR family transcriptional regulator [Pseudooceanicola sediminis]|uniref:GntR family transcriptional regulator n=1 Tax=Pseudooceanicola sediminis TaxID=2211117 RepID=A0A399J1U0_9RHOB|nr:GntR family transcriptional regulator [Pseudooceanicola sediminis]RII37882.1 GntR family transcriptional regulator [Pseudooceanicola sediminis]|tara:strand:- start:39953 stop:40726 length:774 start_codon:yes stop_codon:yes gene_type:complete
MTDRETEMDADALAQMKPADRAYHVIRAAILSGELRPGAHLAENQLAEMCNSSRTPVREALQRLTAEGLALSERRSRFVANFSYEEVSVVFELRARIESYLARIAARKITTEEMAHMQDLILRMDAEEARDPIIFHDLNTQFHDAILRATRSAQLRSVTRQVFALPLVTIKRAYCDQPIDSSRSNAQHRDILAAFRNRDEAWAESAMMGHILSAKPTRPQDDSPEATARQNAEDALTRAMANSLGTPAHGGFFGDPK